MKDKEKDDTFVTFAALFVNIRSTEVNESSVIVVAVLKSPKLLKALLTYIFITFDK